MVGYPPGVADQTTGARGLADANENPLAGWPRAGDRVCAHMREQLLVNALGGAPQRELAQGGQVSLRKVVPDRALGLLRDINLPFAQALDQIFRGKVDDLDIIGLVEDAVGHRLPHADPRDAGDDDIEAFDVLDIERGKDVDAGRDQLLDIDIALWMPTAWGVGVGELVDQHELRMALEDRVQIHLG